jgi:hypothetical protein
MAQPNVSESSPAVLAAIGGAVPRAEAGAHSIVKASAHLYNVQVKEQLFRRLSGELPYELEPVPTEARRLKDGALLLKQTLFVRSESVRGPPCSALRNTHVEALTGACCRAGQALRLQCVWL